MMGLSSAEYLQNNTPPEIGDDDTDDEDDYDDDC